MLHYLVSVWFTSANYCKMCVPGLYSSRAQTDVLNHIRRKFPLKMVCSVFLETPSAPLLLLRLQLAQYKTEVNYVFQTSLDFLVVQLSFKNCLQKKCHSKSVLFFQLKCLRPFPLISHLSVYFLRGLPVFLMLCCNSLWNALQDCSLRFAGLEDDNYEEHKDVSF